MAVYRFRNASYCVKLLLLRISSLKVISCHSASPLTFPLTFGRESFAAWRTRSKFGTENELGKQIIIVPARRSGKSKAGT